MLDVVSTPSTPDIPVTTSLASPVLRPHCRLPQDIVPSAVRGLRSLIVLFTSYLTLCDRLGWLETVTVVITGFGRNT